MGNDINNLLCQCGCANKSNIDPINVSQTLTIKKHTFSEKKASQKLSKFLTYALHKKKIKKLQKQYIEKINNLLLLCSKYKILSKLSPSDFQLLLQKHVNVIINYINTNNSINMNKEMLKDLLNNENVFNNVKDFYIKDIKENQLHFYKEIIEKQGIDIDDEIKKMMSFKWSKLYTIYLNEIFIEDEDTFHNKKYYLSKNMKMFIKRFYFMYIMFNYNYIHTEKSFRKVSLEKIVNTYMKIFTFDNNEDIITIEDELSLQAKVDQMKTGNELINEKENNDDFSPLSLKSNITGGNSTSKAIRYNKRTKSYIANSFLNSNFTQETIHFKKRIEKESTIHLSTKQSTSSFSYISSKQTNISLYKGDFDDNYFPQCKGELINPQEQSYYNGTFRYAQFHGIGSFYQIISDSMFMFYRGEFHKGLEQGYGIKIITSNNKYKIYKGLFIANHIHIGIEYIIEEVDEGTLKFTILEGEFLNDEYIGTRATRAGSEILNENGKKTEKIFVMNKSTYKYYLISSYHYEGMFLNGKEHGDGKVIFIDKENNYSYEYVGGFREGAFHGYGSIIYSEDFFIRKYEGLFYNDQKFYLYGQVIFKSGDYYEGFFDKNFLKSYLGMYIHYNENGSYENYFGEYDKDMKSGLGRFVNMKSKKVLIGTYLKGTKHGNFTLVNSNMEKTEQHNNDVNREIYQSESDMHSNKKNTKHKQFFIFDNNELIK